MSSVVVEPVAEFRTRAHAWIEDHLPHAGHNAAFLVEDDAQRELVAESRRLQRQIFDAGFAGIRYPTQYGGQGLSREHQIAWSEAAEGFQLPTVFNVTQGILGATLLQFGNDDQKRKYLPAMLRGDDLWVQFLSEPSCGSDLAGVLTRADRDGSTLVVNGAKTWSTGAHYCDYGLALVRTDVDVPKHAGLSVLIVPLPSDGITISPIRLSTGASHFCEEFFDDVRVPVENLVGEENDGWRVATGLLFHERAMVGGGGLNDHVAPAPNASAGTDEFVELARRLGRQDDPMVRQLVGESIVLRSITGPTIERVQALLRNGDLPGPSAGILKLLSSTAALRLNDIRVEIGGAAAVASSDEAARALGRQWLGARTSTIAGGSSEIQRNQISERVLGLPAEARPDKGVAFSEVLRRRMRGDS